MDSIFQQMVISIQHGLLEVTNYPGNKRSAIIFNGEVIFTSATIFEPYLRTDSLLAQKDLDLVKKSLRKSDTIETDTFKPLQDIKFNIVFDRAKIAHKPKYLVKSQAKLLYIFNSSGVFSCVSGIIDKLTTTTSDGLYFDTLKLLLSSTLILQIIKDDEQQSNSNLDAFLKNMVAYIQFLEPVNKLDDTLTISTPFGMENFYKTVNIGKVSNVIGRNNCVFVLSNLLTEGCEGSAVFNNKLRLVGIVICTGLRHGTENATLTLAASFQHIFKDFLYQIGRIKQNICTFWKYSSPSWERSMTLITNTGGQGTGTFTKICGKKYILTCSHVVHEVEKTNCQYADGSIECNVVWKNPKFDQPFDIALLEAPCSIPDEYFVKIAKKRPRLGQLIYNAGFPYIVDVKDSPFCPSIFEGRIIKYTSGCVMSDASLQAGQSGGPMLDENGDLVGVCVCNIKAENKIYPQVNIAVPAWEIKTILEQFAKSHDVTVLDNLIAEPNIRRTWGLERPIIESKL